MADRPGQGGAAATARPVILLVDDDVELCELVREFFSRHGLCLRAAHDGSAGLARALEGGYHLLLLDVMLPGLDGLELLHLVRRQSQVPIIMLTARTAQSDRVAGLNAGADDYLPKPFGPEELLARIHAVLRRACQAPRAAEVLEAGGVRLCPSARETLCEGIAVDLTTIEYDLLEFLVRAAGRTVSRDELTVALYQRRASPFDRAVDVHVSHLRKKLGRHGALTRTVRGVGYLFRAGPQARDGS
jgi:two-component system, OmpR family, response regulator CpxR